MKTETHPDSYITPIILGNSLPNGEQCNRLTKREYMATQAMIGIIANAPTGHLSNSKEGAQVCVRWADDLINELNKPQP